MTRFGHIGGQHDFPALGRQQAPPAVAPAACRQTVPSRRYFARAPRVSNSSRRAADFSNAGQKHQHIARGVLHKRVRRRRRPDVNRLGGSVFRRTGCRPETSEPALSMIGQLSRNCANGPGRQRRGHDDDFQIGPHFPLHAADHGQRQIAVQLAFVKFIERSRCQPAPTADRRPASAQTRRRSRQEFACSGWTRRSNRTS